MAVAGTGFVLLPAPQAQGQPRDPATARVVVKSIEPFVITEDGQVRGFSVDLLTEIADRAGFAFELHEVATVQDQLQAIRTGRADLAIAGVSITSERMDTVEFSHPMYNSGLQILVPEASSRSTADKFTSVLVSRGLRNVVGGLLAVIFVVAHVVWLVERRRNADFPRGYLRGVWEGCWWAAVTMATVGYGDQPPRSIMGRVLAIFWMFAAIIMVANLTASISSSLTVEELQGTIHGPQDLFGKRVLSVRGTTSAHYLSVMDIGATEVDSVDEAYPLLQDGAADAIVYDSPVLRHYASSDGKGKVRVVGPVFQREDYGIAMQLGSPYRREVDRALLTIMEDGSYRRLETRWFGEPE
jgi:polar amino acid transport system substrate-binding protein